MGEKTIIQKLMQVQQKLKAPKSQFNKFGGYAYRNCEDILEALKPICAEVGAVTLVTDEIIFIEGRFYVKATARFVTDEGEISSTGFAREAELKKGMDESQITGAASSYARKYALNGLYAIDDTKDADGANTHENTKQAQSTAQSKKGAELPQDLQPAKIELMTGAQRTLIETMLKTHLISDANKKKTLDAINRYAVSKERAKEMIEHIKKTIDTARKAEKAAKELPPDEVVPGDENLSDSVYEPESTDFGTDLIEPTPLEAARIEAIAMLEGSELPAGAQRSVKKSISMAKTLEELDEIVKRIDTYAELQEV